MSIRSPSAALVERVAQEEANSNSVPLGDVIGVAKRSKVVEARKRAWVRLVHNEGFPILGVAIVWGCDRRGIQRALSAAGLR